MAKKLASVSWYQTKDKTKVVPESHPEAGFLIVGKGCEITMTLEEKFELSAYEGNYKAPEAKRSTTMEDTIAKRPEPKKDDAEARAQAEADAAAAEEAANDAAADEADAAAEKEAAAGDGESGEKADKPEGDKASEPEGDKAGGKNGGKKGKKESGGLLSKVSKALGGK